MPGKKQNKKTRDVAATRPKGAPANGGGGFSKRVQVAVMMPNALSGTEVNAQIRLTTALGFTTQPTTNYAYTLHSIRMEIRCPNAVSNSEAQQAEEHPSAMMLEVYGISLESDSAITVPLSNFQNIPVGSLHRRIFGRSLLQRAVWFGGRVPITVITASALMGFRMLWLSAEPASTATLHQSILLNFHWHMSSDQTIVLVQPSLLQEGDDEYVQNERSVTICNKREEVWELVLPKVSKALKC